MKRSFLPARAGVRWALASMFLVAAASRADAGCDCAACVSTCPTYQTVEQTIYVPELVRETRIVNQVICEPEVRERVVTVCRQIPETREVVENYTVMVPQVRTRIQDCVVARPVWREVEQACQVPVPHTETRTGIRNVCRPVHVQEMRTVSRNVCAWDEVPCDGSCGAHSTIVQKADARQKGAAQKGGETVVQKSPGCGGTHRVLRSRCVTEEVPVTVWRNEVYQQEYKYNVTTYHTETRTRMVRVCDVVHEKQSREVTYTVCVPQQRTRTCQVTTYRTVAEPQTQRYTVMVPRTVQREVPVTVCRMVPRQVTCKVPVMAPVYGCGGHGHRHCH